MRHGKLKQYPKVTHLLSCAPWFVPKSWGSLLFIWVPRQLSLLMVTPSMFNYLRMSPQRQHNMQTNISQLYFRRASASSSSFVLDYSPKCSHRTFPHINQRPILSPSLFSSHNIWHRWPQSSPENSLFAWLCGSLVSLISVHVGALHPFLKCRVPWGLFPNPLSQEVSLSICSALPVLWLHPRPLFWIIDPRTYMLLLFG